MFEQVAEFLDNTSDGGSVKLTGSHSSFQHYIELMTGRWEHQTQDIGGWISSSRWVLPVPLGGYFQMVLPVRVQGGYFWVLSGGTSRFVGPV